MVGTLLSRSQLKSHSCVFCLCNGLSSIGVIPFFYKLGDYEQEVRREAGELFL